MNVGKWMLRIALALLVLLAAGCDGGSDDADRRTAPGVAPASPRAGGEGVSVQLPRGWHDTSTEPRHATDPVVRLAVSSGPIRPGTKPCQVSAYDFPATEVALVLVEWTTAGLLEGVRAPPRPGRFTEASLPMAAPPAIECFEGPGGTVQFVEAGRLFGAYVLLGPEAPGELADEARAVLDTVRVEMELLRPVELVALAPKRVEHCRRSALIRPTCPTQVPRVRAEYLSHLSRDVLGRSGILDVFDLERAPGRDQPDNDRPPWFAHVGILAGETERIASWGEPWDRRAVALRDGLMERERTEPVSFGLVTWGDTRGLLFLAPPFPTGGYLGNHLVFVWRAGATSWAVSLHAWEPLTEAVATLRAMTLSASSAPPRATLDARSDAAGVLYVDGSGWACADRVRVDLPHPWAETNAEVARGELHLEYPVPAVAPYRGTVRASQRCADGTTLSAESEIVVGDDRAG